MNIRATLVATGALVGLLMIPSEALTQTTWEFEVAPFVGGTFFLSDLPAQFAIPVSGNSDVVMENGKFANAFTLGMNAGIRIADRFGVEGFFGWLPTQLEAGANATQAFDADSYMYGMTLLYHFDTETVRPFLGVGAGAETFRYDNANWDGHTDFMTNVVAGLNIPFTDVMAVRLEARDCITWFESHMANVDNKAQNDLMLSAGLSFRAPMF